MTVRQPSLETLARHHRAIAFGWWFCFAGGPVWLVVIVIVIKRHREQGDLRWIVSAPS